MGMRLEVRAPIYIACGYGHEKKWLEPGVSLKDDNGLIPDVIRAKSPGDAKTLIHVEYSGTVAGTHASRGGAIQKSAVEITLNFRVFDCETAEMLASGTINSVPPSETLLFSPYSAPFVHGGVPQLPLKITADESRAVGFIESEIGTRMFRSFHSLCDCPHCGQKTAHKRFSPGQGPEGILLGLSYLVAFFAMIPGIGSIAAPGHLRMGFSVLTFTAASIFLTLMLVLLFSLWYGPTSSCVCCNNHSHWPLSTNEALRFKKRLGQFSAAFTALVVTGILLVLWASRSPRLLTTESTMSEYGVKGIGTVQERLQEVLTKQSPQLAQLARACALVRKGEILAASKELDAMGMMLNEEGEEGLVVKSLAASLQAFESERLVFPETHEHRLAYAKLLLRAGKNSQALSAAERAAEIDGSDYVAWNMVGGLSRQMGDVKRAKEAYAKSLELNPDQPRTKEALQALGE